MPRCRYRSLGFIFGAVLTMFGLAVGSFSTTPAQATTEQFSFGYSYSGGGESGAASGIFTTTEIGSDSFQIIDVSGQWNARAITGISTFHDADNMLNTGLTPPIDTFGISFVTSDGIEVNVFASDQYPRLARETISTCNGCEVPPNGGFQFNLSTLTGTPVPEPVTLALLAPGLVVIGVVRRRRTSTILVMS
jgi:hypothetical protein